MSRRLHDRVDLFFTLPANLFTSFYLFLMVLQFAYMHHMHSHKFPLFKLGQLFKHLQ